MTDYMKGLSENEKRTLNNNMRTLHINHKSGSYVNCFKYHSHNSYDHELLKFQIYCELRDQNIPVMTEAIFENGTRADIVDLLNGEVIEILSTESPTDAREKVKSYPSTFKVRFKRTEANKAKYGVD